MNIKRFIGALLAMSLLSPVFAFADTTASTSANAQIQALLLQIQTLQAQMLTLNTAQTNVSTTLGLIRNLRQGMSGEDVKALQAILAADPAIYPEGTISGFFGGLTASAVRKFQKKHGIDSIGSVGPKTLKKLNEEAGNLGLNNEDNDEQGTSTEKRKDGEGKKLCVKVPPGHMIAPGWLKKGDNKEKMNNMMMQMSTSTPVLPPCKDLPYGIMKKLDGNWNGTTTPPVATTTPDVTSPIISLVGTTDLKATTTNVVWTTNEASNSKVWYSTSTPVTIASSTMATSVALVLSHSLSLSGLSTSTTYYFTAVSADASGNIATSSQASFMTLAL